MLVALLAEGVDRNGYQEAWAEYRMKSPSSRRAWIEIIRIVSCDSAVSVALLAEGVDRNAPFPQRCTCDRAVALLAEGVDRNLNWGLWRKKVALSPSSRRAWIEIQKGRMIVRDTALLAEGVDRNT